MNSTLCLVTDADRCRLGSLLTRREGKAWGNRRARAKLYSVLERATPIAPRDAPETLITMNTTVELVDLESRARRIVTLVYPQDLDVVADGVSVFDPFGIALIGCQEGDVIQYPEGHRGRHMRVARIVRQPEHAGLWDL
jgi:regulator of nucleoside diphosphate kinase